MKIEKGQPGYIKTQKQKLLIQSLIGFGLVAAIFTVGYVQTGSRLNWLTFVAVMGCLPAAKVLVGFISICPYRSMDSQKAEEVKDKAPLLTSAFDMIVTSRENIMQVDAVVISGSTVCGYTSNSKTDEAKAAEHMKNVLNENRISKVTVKIFPDYVAFLTRAEGMNSIAQIDGADSRNKEDKIRRIILSISM